MKNLVIIFSLFELFKTQDQAEKKGICDLFNVTINVFDCKDSVDSKGKKIFLLRESENWANEDFQYGSGLTKIPDSIYININVLPEDLMMGTDYRSGTIKLNVSLGLKFGLGLDCRNIKNPLLKEGLQKKMFALSKQDFLKKIKDKSVEPAFVTLKVAIGDLIKKNNPAGYYLNQLVIAVDIANAKNNGCRIEYVKPVCLKKFQLIPSPN